MDPNNLEKLIIYTDGASRGNPGPSGAGAVIYNGSQKELKKYSKYLGEMTNNQAEYQAVIFALQKVKQIWGKKKAKTIPLEIRSDSQLLVSQMEGRYKILDSKIQPLFLKLWNLKFDFKEVKFFSIPREENKEADSLANRAIKEHARPQQLI